MPLPEPVLGVGVTGATRHDVPCGPVNTYGQMFADPQVRHLEVVVHVADPELGQVPHVRVPVRPSESRVTVRAVAPKLGEHTAGVLGALGYTAAELETLRAQKAI